MNPLTDLPQILIEELDRTWEYFLIRFKNSKLSKMTYLESLNCKANPFDLKHFE